MFVEVCPDIARELLNKVTFLAIKDGDLDVAVRSLKAFRAISVTFRDAFENDKAGCKILARYTRALIRQGRHRIVGIDNLIKLHDRERAAHAPRTRGWRKALEWIRELRASRQCDMDRHKQYLAALMYKIDRALCDWQVMHRAMLPETHGESLQKPGGGLPSGPWHVSASHNRRAPHGTCAMCEALLMTVSYDEPVRGLDHREWAKETTALLLKISRADEDSSVQQYVASVAQMLHRLGVAE